MLENLDHLLVRMDPGGFGKPWSLLENLRLPGDSHPTTLWYPSSGLDLVPVARLCRGMPRVHASAPPVDLYLFNDFSARIRGQIQKVSRHLRHGPVLASVDQVTSREVWIDQVVPLGMQVPRHTGFGQHGDGVMSIRAGGQGDGGTGPARLTSSLGGAWDPHHRREPLPSCSLGWRTGNSSSLPWRTLGCDSTMSVASVMAAGRVATTSASTAASMTMRRSWRRAASGYRTTWGGFSAGRS